MGAIKDLTKYPLVQVEWVDSTQPVCEWRYTEDFELEDPHLHYSVGFVLAENKNVIALAQSLGRPDTENEQAMGVMHIPKRAIRKRRKITFSS